MAVSKREIRRRIKAVQNIRKITKAMELVAAAKMRKAQEATIATREYSNTAWHLLQELSAKVSSEKHALLSRRDVKKVLVILIAPDKGLCGSLTTSITSLGVKVAKENADNAEVEVITVGKKAGQVISRTGLDLEATFDGTSTGVDMNKARPIAKLALDGFTSGKYDRVELVYTDFVSTLQQKSRSKTMLPMDLEKDEDLGDVGLEKAESVVGNSDEYIFEPNENTVLDELLPRLLEMQVYQALLEADASEHSARMVAMKNASSAAGDLIDDLTLRFNKARQAAITNEIAEIASGAMAQ